MQIEIYGNDRFGRIVANVIVDEKSLDSILITNGWACHYIQYSYHTSLSIYQELGKSEKKGMWRCSYNVPPWILRLNYNNVRFFNYYTQHMEMSSKDLESNKELVEYYLLKVKMLQQVQINSSIAFNKTLPNIREQIGTWIAEEIYFIEKKTTE